MDRQAEVFNIEWADKTNLHPVGLAAIAVLGLATLVLPRRYAAMPILIMACFVAPAQRIVVATLDFNLLRIMVLFCWMRVLARGESAAIRWQALDKAVILWAVTSIICHTALHGTLAAMINRLGFAFDALGMYFMFRCLIRDWSDVGHVAMGLILLSIPVAVAFSIERSTGHNAFAFLGGVPEITMIRQGRLRCQGAFAHPILAGCFWAAAMPLMAAYGFSGVHRWRWVAVGILAGGFIILACASSTPVTGAFCAGVGAAAFILRWRMRAVLAGIVATLIAIHVSWRMPVWYLLAKVDLVGGSTGWHRYWLIDVTIRHFNDWWLMGTKSPALWSPLGYLDVTNQYVLEAINGGLLTLTFFVSMIVLAFSAVGHTWRRERRDQRRVAMAWLLGVSLFVHCANFVAVSYFGQIIVLWYLSLALIAGMRGCGGSHIVRTAGVRARSAGGPSARPALVLHSV